MNLTYQDLLGRLATLPKEQLKENVTVFNPELVKTNYCVGLITLDEDNDNNKLVLWMNTMEETE